MEITLQVSKTTLKDALCSLSYSATTSHTIETASQPLWPSSWILIQSTQFKLLVEVLLPLSKLG